MQSKKKPENEAKTASLFPEKTTATLFPEDKTATLFPAELPPKPGFIENLKQLAHPERYPGLKDGFTQDQLEELRQMLDVPPSGEQARLMLDNDRNESLVRPPSHEPYAITNFKQMFPGLIKVADRGLKVIAAPANIASNILYLDTRMQHAKRSGKPIPEMTWDDVSTAIRDGWNAKQHATVFQQARLTLYSDETLASYKSYLDRHTNLKRIDTAADFVTSVASEIAFEFGVFGGARVAAGKLPLLKKFFGDVPTKVLHRGFTDALSYKMKQMKLAKNVFENLGDNAGRYVATGSMRAGETWASQADDLMELVGKEYGALTVGKGWAQQPQLEEMVALAERYGANVRIVSPEAEDAIASYTRATRTINLPEDFHLRVANAISEGHTEGSIFLHELGHDIWYNMPDSLRVQWGRDLQNIRKKALPGGYYVDFLTGKELSPAVREQALQEFPTLYSIGSDKEAFSEVFAFMNSGQADKIPPSLAGKYIKLMRDAGVEFVDPVEITEAIMRKQYIRQLLSGGYEALPDVRLTKKHLQQHIDALTFKKELTLDDLDPNQLKALEKNISASFAAPKQLHALKHLGTMGGVPTWKMYEVMGVPQIYDLVDNGMYEYTTHWAARSDWKHNILKQYKKEFGKNWDDLASETLATFADEGPEAVMKGAMSKLDPDEVTFIKAIAAAEKDLWNDPLADIAERLGLIGEEVGIQRYEHYFPHRKAKELYEQMLQRANSSDPMLGILPKDYAIEKALKEKVPAGMNAPSFIKRKGQDVISRDYWAVTDMVYRENLRKVYLEPAFQQSDTIVKGLPPQMRHTVGEYTHAWVKHVRGMPSVWDDKLNKVAHWFAGGLEKVTGGKFVARQRAFEQMSNELRRAAFSGTIGGNTRSIFKQATQSLLTVGTIGNKATLAGWESMYSAGGRRLMDHYRVMLGGRRLALSQVDITSRRGWENLLSKGFTSVDKYINCAGAGNGAMYWLVNNSRKHMDELAEYAAKKEIHGRLTSSNFWDVLADAVDDGHFEDLVELANRNIKFTQFSYNPWDQPRHLWSALGKNTFMYTNWPSHYYTCFLPQMWKQTFKGVNVFGMRATARQRAAMATYLLKTGIIYYAGTKSGYNMEHLLITGPAPSGKLGGYFDIPGPVSPINVLVYGLGEAGYGVLELPTGNTARLKSGLKNFVKGLVPFLPAGTSVKRGVVAIQTDQPPEYIFLPKRFEEKETGSVFHLPGIGR